MKFTAFGSIIALALIDAASAAYIAVPFEERGALVNVIPSSSGKKPCHDHHKPGSHEARAVYGNDTGSSSATTSDKSGGNVTAGDTGNFEGNGTHHSTHFGGNGTAGDATGYCGGNRTAGGATDYYGGNGTAGNATGYNSGNGTDNRGHFNGNGTAGDDTGYYGGNGTDHRGHFNGSDTIGHFGGNETDTPLEPRGALANTTDSSSASTSDKSRGGRNRKTGHFHGNGTDDHNRHVSRSESDETSCDGDVHNDCEKCDRPRC